jgi:predicted RNase H-like nuclease (RuvC/YqgF family)
MKRALLFLIIYCVLMPGYMNCVDSVESQKEFISEETEISQDATCNNGEQIVEQPQQDSDHPFLDRLEKSLPDISLRPFFLGVIKFMKKTKNYMNRYKKLEDAMLCYHKENDQKIEDLNKKINDQSNEIEQLKKQIKQQQQFTQSIARRDITGG